ncbi:hypothetical protein [Kibdelosporangium phytohabitans]|uniref:Sulfatase-modifying factor enzyme domain-containing protein n=1 Tax=Kibdelosporangium phytohabitans TaxID=860235 RepID=A0A0N7F517_9PSEU|nr:hypothetical protein [Kibdelosporangium phytohabitans]ALG12983.1 hypothetical protein AOZ06_44495 [Kibdelosporangium phytohabitans]MBE1464704.1 hypothetical protein [Kibdelosporangium phytohabitans]
MTIDLPGWRSLDDSAAHGLATRIAEDTGCGLVEIRPDRVALFERDGTLFALVPGGEVTVGYDMAAFRPTPGQLASYADSAEEYSLPDIREFVASVTTRRRTVRVPALLVAVEARESEEDDFEAESAALAAAGTRLPTPDEWEWACGAGASTLFRWGEDCPVDTYPLNLSADDWPNAFGLRIGLDPYDAERTTDKAVVCGGDGGGMICGGSGFFLGWLCLATSYRDPSFGELVAEDPEIAHDSYFIRPVIRVG